MIGELRIMPDGSVKDKVQIAIDRLKAFEPPEGYYVAFSGGKDSQCVYHLCEMAGVKFDAHYAITSADPPELVNFIKKHYPSVERKSQHYSDGKPEHYYADGRPKAITMWSLIADHTLPPTRKVRYCCTALKEPGGGWTSGRHRCTLGRERKSKENSWYRWFSRETCQYAQDR